MITLIQILAWFICLLTFILGLGGWPVCTKAIVVASCVYVCFGGWFIYLSREFFEKFGTQIKEWSKRHKRGILIATAIFAILLSLALIIKIIYQYVNFEDMCHGWDEFWSYIANIIDFSELSRQISDDYIEVVTSIAIGTVIGVMTIALPIIVNTIHNLSDRYKTTYVVTLLKDEGAMKVFRIVLVVSIGLSAFWVSCYFFWLEALCTVTFFLFIVTLLLVVGMVVLVTKMTQYMMPSKLIQLVTKKINNKRIPKHYFNDNVYDATLFRYDSIEEKLRMRELKKVDAYDSIVTSYYIIITRVISLFGEDSSIQRKIIEFWTEKCFNAPHIENDIKYYTNCYYNFIYEIVDWSVAHNDPKLQEEAIRMVNILLKSHLGKPRKYGEQETAIHTKKYGLSWATMECLWKVMRKSVACTNDDMFRAYWQIVNNFYSLKYLDIRQSLEQKNQQEMERIVYSQIQYLCCSYVVGRNKYQLLDYILNYSQQVPFAWFLIPNTLEELLPAYILLQKSYSNYDFEMHFSFTDDYNLFSDIKRKNPIALFTSIILYILWYKDANWKGIKFEHDKNTNVYISQLLYIVKATTEDTDWVKYLHLEDLIKNKNDIVEGIESLLPDNIPTLYAKTHYTRRDRSEITLFNSFCLKIINILSKLLSFFKK